MLYPPRRNITDVIPMQRRSNSNSFALIPHEILGQLKRKILYAPPSLVSSNSTLSDPDFLNAAPLPEYVYDSIQKRYLTTTNIQSASPAPASLTRAANKVREKLNSLKETVSDNVTIGTEKVLVEAEMDKYARLADVSYRFGFGNLSEADSILQSGRDTKAFQVLKDPISSNRNWTTMQDAKTGEVVMSIRGSDPDFFQPEVLISDPSRFRNIEDWWVNLHTVWGRQTTTRRYKAALEALEHTAGVLRIDPRKIVVVGHSLGGGLARWLATRFGNQGYGFNSADSPFAKFHETIETPEFHEYRILGDAVSFGTLTHSKEGVTVTTITAKPGTEQSFVEQHELAEQFYEDSPTYVGDKIETLRTTKARNYAGIVSEVASAGGVKPKGALGAASNLAVGELLVPEHKTTAAKIRTQADLAVDTLKFVEIAEAPAMAVDPGGVLVDFIDISGEGLLPEEKHWIHNKIFGEDHSDPPPPTPEEQYSPFIRWIQGFTGRKEEEEQKYDHALSAWIKRREAEGKTAPEINELAGKDVIDIGGS